MALRFWSPARVARDLRCVRAALLAFRCSRGFPLASRLWWSLRWALLLAVVGPHPRSRIDHTFRGWCRFARRPPWCVPHHVARRVLAAPVR